MAAPPTGTVTLLFTDIEGSTRLLHALGPEGYAEELSAHRRVLRTAFERYGGVEMDTQGDAFFVVFDRAPSAVEAAEESTPARVRADPNSDGAAYWNAALAEEGYVGDDVHWAARIAASGHGGQVVFSSSTAELVRDLSCWRRREPSAQGLSRSGLVFQLGDETFPPLKTIANTNLPTPVSSFLVRGHEFFEAAELIGTTRLLSITGPGGCGQDPVRARAGPACSRGAVRRLSRRRLLGPAGNASRSRSRARHDRPGNRRKSRTS